MALKGIRFSHDYKVSPENLYEQTNRVIERCKKTYDQVASVKEDEVTFTNVLKVIGDAQNDFMTEHFYIDLANKIAVDKNLRDASNEAAKKLVEFSIETSMRQDVFKRLVALEKKQPNLDTESKRYLGRLLRDSKRNGLYLPLQEREELKSLKMEINQLCSDFLMNISEDKTILEFSAVELDGLPQDFIKELEKSPDTKKLKVNMSYPHFVPIMKRARNPDTRKRMLFAYGSRLVTANTGILEKVCTLRHKHANLLGFPTHAAFQCDICMAKTDSNVAKFLDDLVIMMKSLWEVEKKELLELKEKDCKNLNIPFDNKLNPYDMTYLTTMRKENKFSVDEEALRPYFSLPVVTAGLLQIYQTLLGLKFTKVDNPAVWHPDIDMYMVEDSSDSRLMGYFYLDLFPREGKYAHAKTEFLQPGYELPDGSRQVAICPVLCNFTKPTKNKPSLLTFPEWYKSRK